MISYCIQKAALALSSKMLCYRKLYLPLNQHLNSDIFGEQIYIGNIIYDLIYVYYGGAPPHALATICYGLILFSRLLYLVIYNKSKYLMKTTFKGQLVSYGILHHEILTF